MLHNKRLTPRRLFRRSHTVLEKEQKKQKDDIDKKLEEQKRIEQSEKWASQGLCYYCGGTMGGLFSKKCKSCGKPQ